MPITPKIKKAIHESKSVDEMRDYALEDGMISLRENTKLIVMSGITTISEMIELFYE